MVCTNCGAHLMETDQFCPKCGRPAGEKNNTYGNFDDTLDIPIEAIERNILSETAAEIKADRRAGSVSHKTAEKSPPVKKKVSNSEPPVKKKVSNSEPPVKKKVSNSEPPVKKKASNPEPPHKKKVVYREEDWEDEDWEDDDWEEDDEDWDEDDEGGVDFITIMTAVVGCVILAVVAVLGFHLYRQYVPKDYDKVAEEEQEEQGEEPEGGQNPGADRETYTLKVIHNVNVRDNPGTSGTNILKVAQEGETYTSYGSPDGGEWYEILLEDGTVGYVFHEYISIE